MLPDRGERNTRSWRSYSFHARFFVRPIAHRVKWRAGSWRVGLHANPAVIFHVGSNGRPRVVAQPTWNLNSWWERKRDRERLTDGYVGGPTLGTRFNVWPSFRRFPECRASDDTNIVTSAGPAKASFFQRIITRPRGQLVWHRNQRCRYREDQRFRYLLGTITFNGSLQKTVSSEH